MADANAPIVNKTGSAVVAIVILVFSMSLIAILAYWGRSENILHQQAMSGSFTMMGIVMGALGLAPFVAQIVPLFRKPSEN